MIAVRRVLLGESYLSPVITRGSPQIGRGYHDEKPITGRQREILQLLAEGRPMKEIAYILALQVGTVAFHKYKIMGALGIKTRAGLIEYAINRHMISSTERIT
jgi:DNA-binding NarL/FixJ family response regulator